MASARPWLWDLEQQAVELVVAMLWRVDVCGCWDKGSWKPARLRGALKLTVQFELLIW